MERRIEWPFVNLAGAGVSLVAMLALPVDAQVTSRVSVATGGAQGNFDSSGASISADGRLVAFQSQANNLVSGDTNVASDVFVRDRVADTTVRVSVVSGGEQGNNFSYGGPISADGRYVAFSSSASNLVSVDTNFSDDAFVRDLQSPTTQRVSLDSAGAEGNGDSYAWAISSDGRFVAFVSYASNLVSGDTNGWSDVFVRDRIAGTTERVSVDSGGVQGNSSSSSASISASGRYVAFDSLATNLIAGDSNGVTDVFVHDRQLGTTERVSVDAGGMQGNNVSYEPSISADGRCVAFSSFASNLVSGDTNGWADIFVRDRLASVTERMSVDSGGTQANNSCFEPSISPDGRHVAFSALASNLVPGDTNGNDDVFVRDRRTGTTERMSIDTAGAQGFFGSRRPSISIDGRFVGFHSYSPLVPGDTNGTWDTFVRDRFATGFASLCDPGVAGVMACPCSNPPSGSGRGCDNSATTGGASLSADGVAYLSMDSLVFTTSGETPNALSIVLQGNLSVVSGLVDGQGVRCVGGVLIRLYTKNAVGGAMSAPDFSAGDPSVSARSGVLGHPILAGRSRWYLVYYRDPTLLGGCPASSTFNMTQTGQVTWWP
jgi:WD40-like Beta Propeller Repeat